VLLASTHPRRFLGRLFIGLIPVSLPGIMQSEPSTRGVFFLHKYQVRLSSSSTLPTLLYFAYSRCAMADLRFRSTSTSPKPVTQKAATDGYTLPSGSAPAPRTNLLTRLLYTSSAILSILCLAYVSRKERTPLQDAYALCSRSGSHIYTVDPDYPRVQCMVVQGSYIVDVGTIGM
jgi:hypothetical protein